LISLQVLVVVGWGLGAYVGLVVLGLRVAGCFTVVVAGTVVVGLCSLFSMLDRTALLMPVLGPAGLAIFSFAVNHPTLSGAAREDESVNT
jgi:hypothetical protein